MSSQLATNADMFAAAVLFACAVSLMLSANVVFYKMIAQINVKPPEDERIGELWFTVSKNAKVLREYRRLYPSGRLNVLAILLFIAALSFMLAAAWEFGFFDFSHLQPYRGAAAIIPSVARLSNPPAAGLHSDKRVFIDSLRRPI